MPYARRIVTNAERRAGTRRTVIDAAAACFDRAGYLSTTLDDITALANLTKGAVYFHFGSKEALAAAVIDEQAAHWPVVIEAVTSRPGTALDHLVSLTYEVNRALRDNVIVRAGFRLSVDRDVPGGDPAATYATWTHRAAALVRKARKAGLLAADVTPASTARVIVAGFIGSRHLAAVIDGDADARKRLDEFWGCLLPRLASGTEPARPLR